MSIVHRYFLWELIKVFSLVLICLFGLYILIDYTSRAHSLHLTLDELTQYYFYTFVSRVDILIPFALLIAGIKTLCQANLRQELVAMRSAGIPLTTLLAPLVWVGLTTTIGIYLITQFIVPNSMQWITLMEDKHSLQGSQGSKQIVHHMTLQDGSKLLYLHFDRARNRFVKSFWIRSLDDIYRIKFLDSTVIPPSGLIVEHLKRDSTGALVPLQTYDEMAFDEMVLNPDDISETITIATERSLTDLWKRLPQEEDQASYEGAQIEAAFFKKMVMPWLCLLAILGPVSFCVAYQRPLRVFYIFSGGIFGLFTLFVLFSAGYTLTQSQIVTPYISLVAPALATLGAAIISFRKLS